LESFTQALYTIKRRHNNVVETMAQGMLEFQDREGLEKSRKYATSIQYFLDRFYMNRVSIRMLIAQHLALHEDLIHTTEKSHRYIGLFHPSLMVKGVVADAAENAADLCEHYYMVAPDVEIRELNAEDIQFAYVPTHLYHILFELFKNAMRATVEFNEDSDDLPKIHVDITKGKEDLTIRIRDQGGGIPHSKIGELFQYNYSTAPKPMDFQGGNMSPLAGLGYGLPLSRIYSKYFGGDLQISSMEGSGTQAYVYLKVLSRSAQEVLPMYNKNVMKAYQENAALEQNLLRDWSDSFYKGRNHVSFANHL
jgi:signal transduction histidine kinase